MDKREKKRPGTMDVILLVSGVALLVFTVVMVRIYLRTGAIPDTLCTCVFGALTGECGVMGWIKTSKERNKERRWQVEDRSDAGRS